MLWRRRDPLLGADDVADLHQVVVDDHGEVIGGESVGLEQDLVVDIGVLEAHVTAHRVVPLGDALGHPQAHHTGRAARAFPCNLLLAAEAAAVVTSRLGAGALRVAHRREPRRRAGAPVRVAARDQPVGVRAIRGDAQRLDVRSMRAADLRSLVPVEPEPAQGFQDQRFGARDVPLLIGVLDAQDEGAAGVTGREPGEERGAHRSEVQRAGGRGRKTRADARAGAGHS